MARAILIALLLTLVVGCSPERKLANLQRDHPELFNDTTVLDTVVILVPSAVVDCVLVPVRGDTVVLTKDRLTIRYVKMPGDTVWLSGECAVDTVKVDRVVHVTGPVITKTVLKIPVWVWLVMGALGVLLLVQTIRKA